jgi:hypothetical protein
MCIMTDDPNTMSSPQNYGGFNTDRYEASSTERAQSALRSILAAHFHNNRKNWNIVALCRQKIAFHAAESKICDICIISADAPVERVVRIPPMICLDVISEEPLALIQNRVDMYEKLGVKHIWMLDPAFRTGWKATSAGLFQVRDDQMMISGTPIGLRLTAIFEEMEELIRPSKRLSVSAALERSRGQRDSQRM